MEIINSNIEEYSIKTKKMWIPIIPLPLLVSLVEEVTDIFINEPICLKIQSPVVVVGDLHGHILDLFRIIRNFHLPPLKSYLFLGDFVDRGEFSTETIIFVFVLKVLFPSRIFIIRGNHEFAEMCDFNGFSREINSTYNDKEISGLFIDAFSVMPLAASVDNSIFAVHGGIGPYFKNISQLLDIKRPINDFDDPIVSEILWSDPSGENPNLEDSPRGLGFLYGIDHIKTFLETNNHTILIRGHQCVENGYQYQLEDKVLTVFSASKYCDTSRNKCGVLLIKPGNIETTTFPPFAYLKREESFFYPMDSRAHFEAPDPPKRGLIRSTDKETGSTPQLPTLSFLRWQIHLDEKIAPKSARVPKPNRLYEVSIKPPPDQPDLASPRRLKSAPRSRIKIGEIDPKSMCKIIKKPV